MSPPEISARAAEVADLNSRNDEGAAQEILARQLAALSLEEHEKILFGLHGLDLSLGEEDDREEDLENKIQELHQEIEKIGEGKAAYLRAKALDSTYVSHPKFCKMFLRAQQYSIPKAAASLLEHFHLKRQLFGDGEILVREIAQSDLQEEERQFLYSGIFQTMPARDDSGRLVVVLSGEIATLGEIDKLLRPFFYMVMEKLKDEQTQKRGTVLVVYHHNDPIAELDYVLQLKNRLCLSSAIPQRLMGAHYCASNPSLLAHIAQYQLGSAQHERFRIRPHLGTWDQINSELRSFGIHAAFGPMTMLPLNQPSVENTDEFKNENGRKHTPTPPRQPSWSTEWHTQWLRRLKVQEEEYERSSRLALQKPGRFDILLGKTSRSLEHTGNRRLALICEMQYQSYTESNNRNRKTEISNRIVSIVHDSGGRFLTWNEETEGWAEVDDKVAQAKVSHNFRHLRSKLAKKKLKEVNQGTIID